MKKFIFGLLFLTLLFSAIPFASAAGTFLQWKAPYDVSTATIQQGQSIEFWYNAVLDGNGNYNVKLYETDLTTVRSIVIPETSSNMGAVGYFNITPVNYQGYGTFKLRLYANDQWGSDTHTITLNVICTDTDNDGTCDDDEVPFSALTITANPQQGIEPLSVQFGCSATGGNQPVSYSWTFGDSATSTLQNPSHLYTEEGMYTATCTAKDKDNDKISKNITITVQHLNQAPHFNAVANKTVNENQLLTFSVSATDADSSTLTYSATNLPLGAVFSNQQFSWTPSYTQAGIYFVNFTVSDGILTDEMTVKITVNKVNRAPVLDFISDKTIPEGVSYSFLLHATDADGDALAFSAQNLPSGAVLQGNTFSWTPNYDQAGNYVVTFTVSDGQLSHSRQVKIFVSNVNRKPTASFIFTPANPTIQQQITFDASLSSDLDGQTLTYAWDFNNDGLSDSTQKIAVHTFVQPGTYPVKLTVSDGELTDSMTKNVVVGAKLVVSSIECFDKVVVHNNQSCSVFVTDTLGNPVSSATVKVYYLDGSLFGTCTTDAITGGCRV
ncbi:PKD domain-containing protein, partial [Candidatus Woesearchaeota archaeon]